MGNLGKIIVTTGFKRCPKCNKSPNLDTLLSLSLFVSLFISFHSLKVLLAENSIFFALFVLFLPINLPVALSINPYLSGSPITMYVCFLCIFLCLLSTCLLLLKLFCLECLLLSSFVCLFSLYLLLKYLFFCINLSLLCYFLPLYLCLLSLYFPFGFCSLVSVHRKSRSDQISGQLLDFNFGFGQIFRQRLNASDRRLLYR